MKTFTAKGTTYRQLNKISLLTVWKTDPSGADWDDFLKHIMAKGYGWKAVIAPKDCIGIHDFWDAWFVSLGFIEVEKDEFEANVGDEFTIINLRVMLCYTGHGIGFVILSGSVRGDFIDDTIYSVNHHCSITKEEFSLVCGGVDWEEVYATRIPNKN